MILERFYDTKLAQASYMVGCQATGDALIIDPNRDIAPYLAVADRHGVRITHVTETHIHADFVSGTRELADRAGARAYLSGEGGVDWKYGFADDIGAVLVNDRDTFMVGNIKVEVLHTPGHTPEHICFMITDTPASAEPMGVFSGDFAFVGAVGRPDLLERAAKMEGTMVASARQLFRSLQQFKQLPDYLQIWPGHGAGSACGKGLGAVPSSTLGYEKLANWGFTYTDEDQFVDWILEGQPLLPRYFAEMKRINKEGPRVLGGLPRPERLPESRLEALAAEGAFIVDTRPWPDFAAGHIGRTINIPLNNAFTNWAGWLIPYDRDFYLIIDERHATVALDEAVRDLILIGLDRVAGYVGSGVLDNREIGEAGNCMAGCLETIAEVQPSELSARLGSGEATLIDVRNPDEWEAGHIAGTPNIPLGLLIDRLDEVPREKPIVLHCRTGARSAIAASLLRAAGVEDVSNLRGGIERWTAESYPVER